jgi:hypothetical protein
LPHNRKGASAEENGGDCRWSGAAQGEDQHSGLQVSRLRELALNEGSEAEMGAIQSEGGSVMFEIKHYVVTVVWRGMIKLCVVEVMRQTATAILNDGTQKTYVLQNQWELHLTQSQSRIIVDEGDLFTRSGEQVKGVWRGVRFFGVGDPPVEWGIDPMRTTETTGCGRI